MTAHSTQSSIDLETRKNPETLEREIDRQRNEIGDIVAALESRLSPNELMARALDYAKANGGEFAGNLGATLKANPVPALLTSVGLAWMMAARNRPASNQPMTGTVRERAGELKAGAGQVRARATEFGQDISDDAGKARQRLADGSQQAKQSLQAQARRARDGYRQLLDEQPLALGAIGIAVGALLGVALPMSRREDRMLGEASDEVGERVRGATREVMAQARERGGELSEEFHQEGRVPLDAGTSGPHRSSL